MNKIDMETEVLWHYNANGTITVELRNWGEPSATLTFPRDDEFTVKDIVQMILDRNENISAMEVAIGDIGDAHRDESPSLPKETDELFNEVCGYGWEKRYAVTPDAKDLAQKVQDLEADNEILAQNVQNLEADNEILKRKLRHMEAELLAARLKIKTRKRKPRNLAA